jgi:type VI secretion system protein ImpJ
MTTRRLNPVAWTEGMFLRPHHFQQHDVFNEERLRYHLHSVNPFHWGIRELVIDEEALSDHRIVILRLEAILPGGTIIRHPGNAVVESREFASNIESLDVHMGIHHLSPSDANAAPRGNGARDVRYVVESCELPDVNQGGGGSPIELVHPNVRLFLTGEEPELEIHETFKLAEVVATGDLKRPFALNPAYAPPLLCVQAHAPLKDLVQKLVSQMAAQIRVVAGRTETYATADLPKMWIRYTLARMTPVLRHLLSIGETRPSDLYSALVETAGALSAFETLEPVDLPLYRHDDLFGSFRALIEFIDVHLQETIPTRFTEIKLAYDSSKRLYGTDELNTDLVNPNGNYFLAINADMDSEELHRLVVEHGKAGSRSGVATLVMLNTKGLRLQQLPAAPTEIQSRAGFEYYKVEPHGPQWQKVREDFSFAISLGRLESADVRLYVVAPES